MLHAQQRGNIVAKLNVEVQDFLFPGSEKHAIPLIERQVVLLVILFKHFYIFLKTLWVQFQGINTQLTDADHHLLFVLD